jgi:hypothetical protein
MERIGYDGNNIENETIWSPYIGRPVSFQMVGNGASIGGVFERFNYDLRFIDLCPSLVPSGDYLRMEEEIPTRVIIGSGSPMIVRPLEDGDLDKIMKNHNDKVDKEKASEGGTKKIIIPN